MIVYTLALLNQTTKAKTMKTAHYSASKALKTVTISNTTRPIGDKHVVSGKAEARKLAKELNAKPWNF